MSPDEKPTNQADKAVDQRVYDEVASCGVAKGSCWIRVTIGENSYECQVDQHKD